MHALHTFYLHILQETASEIYRSSQKLSSVYLSSSTVEIHYVDVQRYMKSIITTTLVYCLLGCLQIDLLMMNVKNILLVFSSFYLEIKQLHCFEQ